MTIFKADPQISNCGCELIFDDLIITKIIKKCPLHDFKIDDDFIGSDLQVQHIDPTQSQDVVLQTYGSDILSQINDLKVDINPS